MAGSGNVLKVQQLLHICSEHFDSKEKEEDKDKKEKKDKDKKEAPADMGAHQVLWAPNGALRAAGCAMRWGWGWGWGWSCAVLRRELTVLLRQD